MIVSLNHFLATVFKADTAGTRLNGRRLQPTMIPWPTQPLSHTFWKGRNYYTFWKCIRDIVLISKHLKRSLNHVGIGSGRSCTSSSWKRYNILLVDQIYYASVPFLSVCLLSTYEICNSEHIHSTKASSLLFTDFQPFVFCGFSCCFCQPWIT